MGELLMASNELAIVRTYCRICAALCGLKVGTTGGEINFVRGDPDHIISKGYICPKGRSLGASHTDVHRLDHHMTRRNGELVSTPWDELLGDLVQRLRHIVQNYGNDSVAIFYGSGLYMDAAAHAMASRLVEELHLSAVYTDLTLDTPNKPVVAALVGGTPLLSPKVDLQCSRLLLIIGCNPVVSHGHTTSIPNVTSLMRDLGGRNCNSWVIDPRTSETAALATNHLAPRAGTDYAVLAFLVREMLLEGADWEYIDSHTVDVDRLAAAVQPFSRGPVAELTGLDPGLLDRLLSDLRRAGRFSFLTGTGVSMSRGANVVEWLTWALAIVTGSFEKTGGMWFHPGFLNQFEKRNIAMLPADIAPAAGPSSRPQAPTWFGQYPAATLPAEIESGGIRALLNLGGSLVTCLPDADRVTKALKMLDVFVVADIAQTSSSVLATHVIACAGQLERPDLPANADKFQSHVGTQYTPAVIAPRGARRPLWLSLAQIADGIGLNILPPDLHIDTATADDILRYIAANSRVGFDELKAADGPVISPYQPGPWVHEKVLRGSGWRLAPTLLVEQLGTMLPPEGLVLINRRQPRVMNAQMRAAHSVDHFEMHMHSRDAELYNISSGDIVVLSSAKGSLTGPVRVDDRIQVGTVSVPHGWDAHNVNNLTDSDELDSLTGMPLFSGIPVTIAPSIAATAPAES